MLLVQRAKVHGVECVRKMLEVFGKISIELSVLSSTR